MSIAPSIRLSRPDPGPASPRPDRKAAPSRNARWSVICLVCLLWLAATSAAQAQDRTGSAGGTGGGLRSAPRVALTIGKSVILDSPTDVSRVSVADPKVADFLLLSPREIYLTGKTAGVTNLTLWENGAGRASRVYDLEVAADSSRLKKMLHDVLPSEPGIAVVPSGDSVTLSGTVGSATAASRAVAMAETFAPGKVVNLLQVAGVQQVMLEVRIAEMSKTLMRRLGFNFNYLFKGGQDFAYTFLNRLTYLDQTGRLILSDKVDGAFRFTDKNATWSGFIDALKEDGLIKVLAEPTLVCLSGQTAQFLAGGEIPVPVPQGLGTVAIEYKPYGVGLRFTPTVLDGDRISLLLSPEVSELDFTNAITINGFTIPALSTRRASTAIELNDGQAFAVAGLLRDNTRDVADKVPFLGDVPVLGNLFRSSQYQKNETELVIIATPHLVKPLDRAVRPLPTDAYKDQSNEEYYLNLPARTLPRIGNRQGGGGDAPAPRPEPSARTGQSNGQPTVQSSGQPSGQTGSGGFDGPFGPVLPTSPPVDARGTGGTGATGSSRGEVGHG